MKALDHARHEYQQAIEATDYWEERTKEAENDFREGLRGGLIASVIQLRRQSMIAFGRLLATAFASEMEAEFRLGMLEGRLK